MTGKIPGTNIYDFGRPESISKPTYTSFIGPSSAPQSTISAAPGGNATQTIEQPSSATPYTCSAIAALAMVKVVMMT